MTGKIVAIGIVLCAALAGGALYYLQVFGFYRELPAGAIEIRLTPVGQDTAQQLPVTVLQAIDAQSSPIRFRACFELPAGDQVSLEGLKVQYQTLADAEPRIAPGWFDCFDAQTIAADLRSGDAVAFLGEKNIAFGVDRIVAIDRRGRGFVWHDLNDCGEKSYDGTIIGEECPKFPETK